MDTTNLVTIDLETAGLGASADPDAQVWGATFTTDEEGTIWVTGWEDVADTYQSYADDGYTPVFHNGKFDARVFAIRGVHIPAWHDTKVMSYQVWPGYPSHGLEDVAKRLRLPQNKMKLPDDWDWNNPDHTILEKYAIRDGEVQHKVLHKLIERMDKLKVTNNYLEVDMPYELETIYMEDTGLYVAPAQREAMQKELEEVLSRNYRIAAETRLLVPAKLEWDDGVYVPQAKTYSKTVRLCERAESPSVGYHKKNGVTIYDHCQLKELNLNSSRQVCWVMQQVIGWEPHQFTDKTCEPSTGVEHMSTFDHPFVDAFLEWQQASKIHGTFLEAFEKHSDNSGFVHGHFNTTVTATGRLSSSAP